MVEVIAPMVASVLDVRVRVGEDVGEGDILFVVESMKMEIPVFAPRAGRVRELRVTERDIIAEGDVLAVIEDHGTA